MDVVAQAGAVASGPVHAGDGERLTCLVGGDHLAQRVGGRRVLQPGAQLRVRPDGVEVAQRDSAHAARGGFVRQDALEQPLRRRVRTLGVHRAGFVDHVVRPRLVHGGGGGQHEAAHAEALQRLQQRDRFAHVVVVVGQRLRHRLGHDDFGCAVDDGVDVGVLGEYPLEQRHVGDVTFVAVEAAAEGAQPGGEIVQNHRRDARVGAAGGDGGPDVSGAAGDQYFH